MVRDHEGEEHAVKLGPLKRCKLRHIFGACHTSHLRVVHGVTHHMVGMIHIRVVHTAMVHANHYGLFAARRKPLIHECDLVSLARQNPASDGDDIFVIGARCDQFGHFDRLLVVDDHALHESDIGIGVACFRNLTRLTGAERLARLTGSAGKKNGSVLGHRQT